MADNFRLSSLSRLLRLANEKNPAAHFTEANVSAGVPTISTLNDKNTVVQLTGKAGSNRKNSRSFYYDRLDLATFFQTYLDMPSGPIEVPINNPISVYDLLPRINAIYDLSISEDDVINETLTSNTHSIKAASGSLAWVGNAQVSIVPLPTPLSEILVTLLINPFVPTIFEVSAEQQILDAINQANGTSLTLSDVEIAAYGIRPGYGSSDAERQLTLISISALYTGSVIIDYSAANLSATYPSVIDAQMSHGVINSEETLLPNLATDYDVVLTADEVSYTSTEIDTVNHQLTTGADSLLWLPNGNVVFYTGKIHLADSQFSKVWDGLFESDITSLYVSHEELFQNMMAANTPLVSYGFELGLFAGSGANLYLEPSSLTTITGSKNTRVTLHATNDNPRYSNQTTIEYNRLDASVVFSEPLDMSALPPLVSMTTRDLIEEINSYLPFEIDPMWVDDVEVSLETDVIPLTFNNSQYVFIPGTSFTIIFHREIFVLDDNSLHELDDGSIFVPDEFPNSP